MSGVRPCRNCDPRFRPTHHGPVVVDTSVMNDPRRLLDVSLGDWVNERLLGHGPGPEFLVGSVVPTGFARVVRVLHPAGGRSWARVAAESGRIVHPLVQWCCIASAFDGGRSSGLDPDEGSVPAGTLTAILDQCPRSDNVVQAVWSGFGSWTDVEEGEPLMPGWGGRSYRLFTTAQEAVTTWPGMVPGWPQSANLIWPADHSWCVATEIDWDSTLIAASSEVAEAMLADVRLEAFAVDDHDDLSWCGDKLNARPAWLALQCTDSIRP